MLMNGLLHFMAWDIPWLRLGQQNIPIWQSQLDLQEQLIHKWQKRRSAVNILPFPSKPLQRKPVSKHEHNIGMCACKQHRSKSSVPIEVEPPASLLPMLLQQTGPKMIDAQLDAFFSLPLGRPPLPFQHVAEVIFNI